MVEPEISGQFISFRLEKILIYMNAANTLNINEYPVAGN
jgi:hypothetical protein